jgi:hypothetical protein
MGTPPDKRKRRRSRAPFPDDRLRASQAWEARTLSRTRALHARSCSASPRETHEAPVGLAGCRPTGRCANQAAERGGARTPSRQSAPRRAQRGNGVRALAALGGHWSRISAKRSPTVHLSGELPARHVIRNDGIQAMGFPRREILWLPPSPTPAVSPRACVNRQRLCGDIAGVMDRGLDTRCRRAARTSEDKGFNIMVKIGSLAGAGDLMLRCRRRRSK